ncbi:MAG: heme-binding protein [Saprospiraceae bacterium]|nr:heme-binding protein [Saprospiraceae bacterium]
MKALLIILGSIVLIFGVVQILSMRSQNNIETYPFTVVKTYDQFEVRQYEASLFTTVKLNTQGYEESSGRGFSILAGYIFGNNDRNEKIAMTSPVAMSLEDSVTMMFMVPSALSKETLPTPGQSGIEFMEEPAKTVAAIRFKGWANDDKIKKYREELTASLEAEGIAHTNRFYYLGYNPPYEVINRKNEIIVELKSEETAP